VNLHQPKYLELAWGELGTREIAGAEHNHRITAYHATTMGGESPDEVSWCSSFVNAMVTRGGVTGTNSKAARSWMTWGEDCEPEYGCVCVLWRVDPKSWQGHVGFLVGEDGGNVYMLGGNQSNRVRVSRYPKNRVLGYRRAG